MAAQQPSSGALTDEDIASLSRIITDEDTLCEIARSLGVEYHQLGLAAAAEHILRNWCETQGTREEAREKLLAALERSGIHVITSGRRSATTSADRSRGDDDTLDDVASGKRSAMTLPQIPRDTACADVMSRERPDTSSPSPRDATDADAASEQHSAKTLQSPRDRARAEGPSGGICFLKVHTENLSEAMRVLKEKQEQHGDAKIVHLEWKDRSLSEDECTESFLDALQLSPEISTICIWSCQLVPQVYQRLTSQLKESCSKLRKLDLGELEDAQIMEDVGTIVGSTASLQQFHLYKCKIPDGSFREIATQLASHTLLHTLQLDHTQNIPAQLGAALEKMKNLRIASFESCKMTTDSSHAVLKGLSACCLLEELKLKNNRLTDGLAKLFNGQPAQPRGASGVNVRRFTTFPELGLLWLNHASLSQNDAHIINQCIQGNHLPKLEDFEVSFNAHLLPSALLQGQNRGLVSVTRLSVSNASLRPEDVRSVRDAVRGGKLPRMRSLALGFSASLAEPWGRACLAELTRECVSQYGSRDQDDFRLIVRECVLTLETLQHLKNICSGTNVKIQTEKLSTTK